MAWTVENLMNTSSEDMKGSIEYIRDLSLLRQAHRTAVERGYLTKALFLERRIKRLRKEVAA